MDKESLDLLEKAFSAEVEAALGHGLGIIQSKSKCAAALEADGYLIKARRDLGGRFPVTVHGYALTIKGNAAYCTSDRCATVQEMDGDSATEHRHRGVVTP